MKLNWTVLTLGLVVFPLMGSVNDASAMGRKPPQEKIPYSDLKTLFEKHQFAGTLIGGECQVDRVNLREATADNDGTFLSVSLRNAKTGELGHVALWEGTSKNQTEQVSVAHNPSTGRTQVKRVFHWDDNCSVPAVCRPMIEDSEVEIQYTFGSEIHAVRSYEWKRPKTGPDYPSHEFSCGDLL